MRAWRLAGRRLGALGLAGLSMFAIGAMAPAPGIEAAFLEANAAAMDRMMAGMAARPTGDIDQDFVSMMEPHHRGAIEMAQAELRYGRNEHLRRIAQEIIVDQQQEIVAMRIASGRPLPVAGPSPDQATAHRHAGASGHQP